MTDHKNLLANNNDNDRVFRWKNKIEEYGPTLVFIKGIDNVAADALGRLPITENLEESIEVMLNHPPYFQYDPL